MKLLLSFIFIFLSTGFICVAQPKYTTTDKWAIRNFEAGVAHYDKYNYEKATEELKRAIEKDERFIEPSLVLVNVYVEQKKYEMAIEQYKRVLSIDPNFFPSAYYNLGSIEISIGKYSDAKSHFEKYLKVIGAKEPIISKAKFKIESCEFAIQAMAHPVPFKPENLGEAINSKYDEYIPSLTVDDQTMIYTRNRPQSEGSSAYHEDFYISHRTDKTWQKSQNAGARLNTLGNEGVPNLSHDGKLLFFAACHREDGKGSCDIYYSRQRPDGWTKPINLGGPINTGMWESQPSFASDGRTLYFVRGRITGRGIREQDIYVSSINNEGLWSVPEKLPDYINTDEEEEFVFIHPDNQTLYFSSDGHMGMGGIDIYVSRRQPDGKWGKPVNLGYPINTFKDERGLLVGPKGDVAYISSDREGGLGGLDLYSFQLYEKARPLLTSYVKGTVADSQTDVKLEASFEIIDLESGETVISSWSEKGTGEFIACLTAGKDYALNVSKDGYLFYSDHFSCKNPVDLVNAYDLEVKLHPAKEGGKVVLKNVFFDTNQYELKPQSFSELHKLVGFLKANKDIRIEVSGHTDNTGDKAKNKTLSENRAKAVYDYLISEGINEKQITYAGYGDSKPISTNDTEKGRAQNRRTEFLIIAPK